MVDAVLLVISAVLCWICALIAILLPFNNGDIQETVQNLFSGKTIIEKIINVLLLIATLICWLGCTAIFIGMGWMCVVVIPLVY